MSIRRPSAFSYLVFALIAVGIAALAGGRTILHAAQGTGESPRARLLILEDSPRVLYRTVYNHPDDYRRFQRTQQTLVKSDLVLTAALRDRKLAGSELIRQQRDSVTWLREKLKVEFIGDSEVMEISLNGAEFEGAADIVNAVKKAYMDEVVIVDQKRRTERYDMLQRLNQTFNEVLKKKRGALRNLAEIQESGVRVPGAAREVLPHLYQELRSQQVQLRLERAEIETLLEQRKKGEVSRNEGAQLEDRLAVLTVRQRALGDELERLTGEMRNEIKPSLDVAALKDELAQVEATAKTVVAELESLKIEQDAPPRIRTIDDARPSRR